jgi:hypothetical protein
MGVLTKKYAIFVSFCPKLVIFGKTVGTYRFLAKISTFSKPLKIHIRGRYR